jgi:uncharacterized protein (DUF305 family)
MSSIVRVHALVLAAVATSLGAAACGSSDGGAANAAATSPGSGVASGAPAAPGEGPAPSLPGGSTPAGTSASAAPGQTSSGKASGGASPSGGSSAPTGSSAPSGSASSQQGGGDNGVVVDTIRNAPEKGFLTLIASRQQTLADLASSGAKLADHPSLQANAKATLATTQSQIRKLETRARHLKIKYGHALRPSVSALALGLEKSDANPPSGLGKALDALSNAKPYDKAYIDAAILANVSNLRVTRAVLPKATDDKLKALARDLLRDQAKQLGALNALRTKWYGSPAPISKLVNG